MLAARLWLRPRAVARVQVRPGSAAPATAVPTQTLLVKSRAPRRCPTTALLRRPRFGQVVAKTAYVSDVVTVHPEVRTLHVGGRTSLQHSMELIGTCVLHILLVPGIDIRRQVRAYTV